jgi:hypothetical protein
MTPSSIKPATFWLVAQYLNQLHHHLPLSAVEVNDYIHALATLTSVPTRQEFTWSSDSVLRRHVDIQKETGESDIKFYTFWIR